MKKILIILTILLLAQVVNAQELEEKAGITPDNTILWGIDRALERIRMMLTIKEESKINYGLKIAEERLAEIKEMHREDFGEGVEIFSTTEKGKKIIEKAQIAREKIINKIKERTDKIEDGEEIRAKVEERLQKHIEVLNTVLEEAPEQAKIGLETAIEKLSQVLEKIKAKRLIEND